MANTYVAIATVTVGSGGASSIAFSSIPGTYTDLLVKLSTRSNRSGDIIDAYGLRFNGDTGNNYSRLSLRGDGSAVSSNSNTGSYGYIDAFYMPAATATSNTFDNTEIYIPNYTSSNQKSISLDNVSETNGTESYMTLAADKWTGTAAITSITFIVLNGTSFVQYSTATLYGIKNS